MISPIPTLGLASFPVRSVWFLQNGEPSHLVSLLLFQFVHGPLQSFLQQVHQPHCVSRPGLKLLPAQETTSKRSERGGAYWRTSAAPSQTSLHPRKERRQ